MKINRTVYPFHKQIQTLTICYTTPEGNPFVFMLQMQLYAVKCTSWTFTINSMFVYTNEKIIKCDNAIVQHSVYSTEHTYYTLFDI